MVIAVNIPKLGLIMTKACVTKVYVKAGDYVNKGQTLFEIETNKIQNEIEAPEEGYITSVFVAEGDEKDIQTTVCTIDTCKSEL